MRNDAPRRRRKPVGVSDMAGTRDLVRRTVEQSGQTGLPEASTRRIRAGFAKLKAMQDGIEAAASEPAHEAIERETLAEDRAPVRLPLRVSIAMVGLAFVLLLPVWVLPTMIFLAIVGFITFYYGIGHDRVCEMAIAYFRRVERRNPAKAARILRRAAQVSAGLSRVAEKLPARWTEGLYLPDFAPEEDTPEIMTRDPFERLGDHVGA